MKKLLLICLLATACGQEKNTAPKTDDTVELNEKDAKPAEKGPQQPEQPEQPAAASMNIDWVKQPFTGENDFTVSFANLDGFELVDIVQFMPSMGHGAPRLNLSWQRRSEGTSYNVTGLLFSMSGAWEVEFVLSNGVEEISLVENVEVK